MGYERVCDIVDRLYAYSPALLGMFPLTFGRLISQFILQKKYGWWIRSKSRVAYKDSDSSPECGSSTVGNNGSVDFSQLDATHEKEMATPMDETSHGLFAGQQSHHHYHQPSFAEAAPAGTPKPSHHLYSHSDSRGSDPHTDPLHHDKEHDHDRRNPVGGAKKDLEC